MRVAKIVLALAFGVGASGVLSGGREIVATLTTIKQTTDRLTHELDAWSGTLFGALPMNRIWQELLSDIGRTEDAATASQMLNAPEAVAIADTAAALSWSVRRTMASMVEAKPRFEKLRLNKQVVASLRKEQAASTKASDAITAKLQIPLRPVAKVLADGFNAVFIEAIAAFGGEFRNILTGEALIHPEEVENGEWLIPGNRDRNKTKANTKLRS